MVIYEDIVAVGWAPVTCRIWWRIDVFKVFYATAAAAFVCKLFYQSFMIAAPGSHQVNQVTTVQLSHHDMPFDNSCKCGKNKACRNSANCFTYNSHSLVPPSSQSNKLHRTRVFEGRSLPTKEVLRMDMAFLFQTLIHDDQKMAEPSELVRPKNTDSNYNPQWL